MPKLTIAGFGRKVEALIKAATVETITVTDRKDSQVTLDTESARAILTARAAVEAATREKDRLETELKALLGDATEVVVDGQVVFTYKAQDKRVLDGARLKEERPEVYEVYLKDQTVRPLLVKSKIVTAIFG